MAIEAGVVQTIFTADASQFAGEAKKVDAALQNTAAVTTKVEETTASSNRKRVESEKWVNDQIFKLTASRTERDVYYMEQRLQKGIEVARSQGASEAKLLELLEAIAEKRAQILANGGAQAQQSAEIVGEANNHAGLGFIKTGRAVNHMGMMFGATGGHASHLAAGLYHLTAHGINPAFLAAAALAVTLGILIKKHEADEEAIRKETEAYAEQRAEIAKWQGEVSAIRAGTKDSEERGLRNEIDLIEKSIALKKQQQDQERKDFIGGKKSQLSLGDIFTGKWSADPTEQGKGQELTKAIEEQERALEKLRAKLVQVTVVREAEVKVEEKSLDTKGELFRFEQERKKSLEENAEWDRKILEASIKEVEFEKETAKIRMDLDRAVTYLHASTAKERMAVSQDSVMHDLNLAFVSGGNLLEISSNYLKARAELQAVSSDAEVAAEEEKHARLIDDARAHGLETLEIEAALAEAIAAIKAKNAAELQKEKDRISKVMADFADKTKRAAEHAAKGLDSIRSSARGAAGAMRELNDEGAKLLAKYREVSLAVNNGAGMGNLRIGTLNEAQIAINRGQFDVGIRAPAPSLTIINATGGAVGTQAKHDKKGWLVHVAEDLQNGGLLDETLRARYPQLSPGGVGQ